MPKDKSIKRVMVIGSGPIVIGQAAEFDYAGTQACRALKEEGLEVILINSNKILVLGGAGYIGSHTVYRLIESGNEVVVFDNLETGHIEAVHPKAKFYKGDLRNRSEIDSVFDKEKGIDAVIHFAANSLVGESMTNPLKYYDNNLNGTKVLLQSMVAHGIDKIVFSSTAATYGEPERTPILETDPTNPTNCYGETKKSMERMFYWVEKAHGLRYVSLRYFNACGAHISGKSVRHIILKPTLFRLFFKRHRVPVTT